MASVLDEVRHSPEYAAAWDVEVWRTVQIHRARADAKQAEKKLIEAMKKRVDALESDRMAQLEKRVRAAAAQERKHRMSSEMLAKKRQKIQEMEASLARQLAETEAFRKRITEEADARVARVKEEVQHQIDVLQQRDQDHQEQRRRADERIAASQKEYLKLWEEFSHFKTKMLTNAGPHLTRQMDDMRSQHETQMLMLTERADRRVRDQEEHFRKELASLQTENTRLHRAAVHKKRQIEALEDKNRAAESTKMELLMEIDYLKKLYGDAVGGNSKQQKMLESLLKTRHTENTRSPSPVENTKESMRSCSYLPVYNFQTEGCNTNEISDIQAEIERLRHERHSLLSLYGGGGIYTEDSPIIRDITHRIEQLSSQHCGA